jgi:hypothetical protein
LFHGEQGEIGSEITLENKGMLPKRLKQIIKPPMKQAGEDATEHSQEEQYRQKRVIPIKVIYPCAIGGECKYQKGDGTNPPKPSRAKRLGTWIKRNFFNAMLTLFTALYAMGFLFDAYVTKRAYIVPDPTKDRNGRAVAILPDDRGVEILFSNVGQTPVRKYAINVWFLKEKETVLIDDIPKGIPNASLPAGFPIRLSLRWPDAPQDIPRIKKEEIGVGFLVRIVYQDAFYIWHCEEFSAHYEHIPFENTSIGVFAGMDRPMPVCNSAIRSIRFNRICVPSADKSTGAWIETWEGFSEATPSVPVPENDPAPCQQHREKDTSSNNLSLP